ncbi:MAG: hypothetical protein WCP18_01345 [bacterium]
MLKKIFKIYFLFGLMFLLFPISVRAMAVSPLIVNVELKPGESQEQIISLFNESDQPIKLKGYTETFKPQGEKGKPEIVPPSIHNQAVDWLVIKESYISIAPKQTLKIPVTVKIPRTADAGGYYLANMWETVVTAGSGQVKISSRVGVLFFIKVKGDIKESLQIADFGLSNKNNFFSYTPVSFSARLQNDGKVHVAPVGRIVITNMFGKVTTVLPFNADEHNVLPDSFRQFDEVWGQNQTSANWLDDFYAEVNHFALGKYTARLDLEYGDNKNRLSSNLTSFWIIPYHLLLLIFIIILVLSFLFRKKSKKRKHKK